jgi:hypothetical protein
MSQVDGIENANSLNMTPTIGTRMAFVGLPTEEYEALRAENKSLRSILDTIWQETTDSKIKSTLATWLSEQKLV